jgi:hypothetical protein
MRHPANGDGELESRLKSLLNDPTNSPFGVKDSRPTLRFDAAQRNWEAYAQSIVSAAVSARDAPPPDVVESLLLPPRLAPEEGEPGEAALAQSPHDHDANACQDPRHDVGFPLGAADYRSGDAKTALSFRPDVVPTPASRPKAPAHPKGGGQRRAGVGLAVAAIVAGGSLYVRLRNNRADLRTGPNAPRDAAQVASSSPSAQEAHPMAAVGSNVVPAERSAWTAPQPVAAAASPATAPPVAVSTARAAWVRAPTVEPSAVSHDPVASAPLDSPVPGMRPADLGPTHNVPDEPSQGSLQAWSNKFNAQGRSCVAGATDASRATVTFAANGTVTHVVVEGWAVLNGRADCVRATAAALRIDPFLRPSFSFPFPLRP